MSALPSSAKQHVLTSLHRFLIMFAYLLVIMAMFQLHEIVILRQHNIPYTRFGFAVVKALILAKVMLLGDEVKLGTRLKAQSVITRVIGRSVLFTILFIAFDLIEQIVRALFTGRDITISDPGGSMLASLIIATITCVALVPYFTFVELGRLMGTDKLTGLVFSNAKHADDEPVVASGS